jgi:hypothetical protein
VEPDAVRVVGVGEGARRPGDAVDGEDRVGREEKLLGGGGKVRIFVFVGLGGERGRGRGGWDGRKV